MFRVVNGLSFFMLSAILFSSAALYGADKAASSPASAPASILKKDVSDVPAFILDAVVPLDPESVEGIFRAQKVLASRQKPDGSWNGQYGGNNAGEIAFCILALMINGTVPGEGEYSKNISLGIQYLINLQRKDGLITGSGGGTMYQHALATLALSEVYGMTSNPRIRSALIKAVNLIVAVQHPQGGWRYDPAPQQGDISVTVMQVMALRSAADAGIYVPEKTFRQSVEFIRSCYNTRTKGFAYMAGDGGAIGFARTAAGIVSLQSLGLTSDSMVKDAVPYILKEGFKGNQGYYWYGHYYASVALYHYGGGEWQEYYPKIKNKILGDWRKTNYRTLPPTLDLAWQIMVLGVPYRYLPIYQR